jgi:hypothetical protein
MMTRPRSSVPACVASFLLVARLARMPELAETVDVLRVVLRRRQRKDKFA